MVPISHRNRNSFAWRAFSAVALMIGFYLLAAGIAFGLLFLIYAEVVYAGRLHIKLAVLCLIGSFAVLRGCFFFRDRFEVPGPEITERDEPRLFALIRSTAAQIGARMPSHVYLIPDVNAFVTEVGGWMGILGSRRVMAIGVGMLNTDSVGQLKATIAHEFGHFQGGDTRLGGFLYRTRSSIGRVVAHLGDDSLLSLPFMWYGKLFQQITLSIARGQELSADELSVVAAGKQAHIEGLKREAVGGMLFHGFLDDEVTPVLREGFVPRNIFEGYRKFLRNLGEDGLTKKIEEVILQQTTDPEDTHPALNDRLAYAAQLPDPGIGDDPTPARMLLSNPDAVESMMTARMLELNGLDNRGPVVGWDQVAGTVYARRMTKMSEELWQVRHPRQSRWLDELDRLKGDQLS